MNCSVQDLNIIREGKGNLPMVWENLVGGIEKKGNKRSLRCFSQKLRDISVGI